MGNLISTIVITNINIAIVGMVKQQNTSIINSSSNEMNLSITRNAIISQISHNGSFTWNEAQQSTLLGAFSWMLWLTLIPGGMLSAKYGSKVIFGGANLVMSLLSLVIPVFAYNGVEWVIGIRVIQGMMDGLGNSCIHSIASKWIPENERCWFMATYVGGKSMAVVLAYPFFGWIIEVSSWENVFYISGILGVIWCIFWYFLMYDTPAQHPTISR